jgi:nucleotidyltransferase/DNA polymerase involved in DNA repair
MFATIYIPDFFLQAALRHEQVASATPVALIDENETKPVIIQCNGAAEQARVCVGMAPSQGLARCLNLVIKTRSLAKERALANLLLQYCFSLSPGVEATAAGLWTIQFTRTDHLDRKLSDVIHQLGQCDIVARAGIAPTPDMSFLAANLARPVLQIADPAKFLAPLPIDILALSAQH